jgi:acyl dehydratase
VDLEVGQKAQREMAVTAAMVKSYAEITGDYNPLHFYEEFTSKTRFDGLICQGGVTTGLLHVLVAMGMPGPGTVFLSQSWSFPKPVYIGDTITAEATVTSANNRRSIAKLDISIKNKAGDEVMNGEATVFQA